MSEGRHAEQQQTVCTLQQICFNTIYVKSHSCALAVRFGWCRSGLSGYVWTCPAPLNLLPVEHPASSRWRQRESWLFIIKFNSYSWYVEQKSIIRFLVWKKRAPGYRRSHSSLFLTDFFFDSSIIFFNVWRHPAINVHGVRLHIFHIP